MFLAAMQLLDAARSVLTARGRRQGGLRGYLSHGSTWLQLVNNALLLTGVGLWWTFVNSHAKTLSMELRYPVGETAETLVQQPLQHGRSRLQQTLLTAFGIM
jgi:hypothetical protein